MKKSILVVLMSVITSSVGLAQQSDEKLVKSVITEFSKAGDANDSEKLATYLDDNYRIVMNRLFGSEEISVMGKADYLEKIKTKEYGGDTRKLKISDIVINGNTGSALVEFKGSKMTFISIILLVKDKNGNWKLISDTPIVPQS